MLKVGSVNGPDFDPTQNKALPASLQPSLPLEVRGGDILMSRASGSANLVGRVVVVNETRPHLMFSDKHFRIHVSEAVHPRFLVYTLGNRTMRDQIELSLSSFEGMARNIGQEVVRNLLWALPPRPEQDRIVAHLDGETAKLDTLAAKVRRGIELLRERRLALITEVVLGQRRVTPEMIAGPPAEAAA